MREVEVTHMSMTLVEKILARAAGLPSVKAGDVVEPKVDLAMSHENAALVINQFLEIYKGTGSAVAGPIVQTILVRRVTLRA